MPRSTLLRAARSALLVLFALAGCRDSADQPMGPQVHFAQGDNGIWTVNSLADPGDGLCDEAECTLREAIADAAPGDEVVFATTLQGDIPLAQGHLLVDKSLTIDGAGRITVDARRISGVIEVASTSVPDVTLLGLTFTNGLRSGGGGVAVGAATLTLDGVTVSGNESVFEGGGISVGPGSVVIRNSTITGNIAANVGGGIYLSDGARLTLVNSTVAGNEADGSGAAIFNSDGASAIISRSTISGNRLGGTANGAGIRNRGTLELRSSTVTRNAGGASGGFDNAGSMTAANSIVLGNTNAAGEPVDCAGSVTSLGYNIAGDGSCSSFVATGDQLLGATQAFTEVMEQAVADNGGPTVTHALLARGRAVDAGYCPGETADQRGFGRPVDDPTVADARDACDIGAYELQGPVAAVADLMISQAVNKTSVKQGERLTYTLRVRNLGPQTAPDVVVTDLLPAGATLYEVRHNKGTHTGPPRGETGTVTWSLGDVLDQANETAELTVTVIVKGKTTITNTASVAGEVSDPNPANNSASIQVSVAAGSAGKTGKAGGKK